ncbi:hypothetical protein [Fredinandcohnia quinoae]|uniref:Group-specific protein n=1 Tax=Fredinandcohnia quinoae TaxID=2918902 RepID=A0AAW5E3Y4_9BACI|nr:hypothetical protein [Fredinandcohnia sp. SECRCQ15]MCH1627647.1 hypothetical protein [Fredinandcohnia sp. SECRCQ15]
MKIAVILVVLIAIVGLIGTIAVGGKGDDNYRTSTKGNVTRLTLIYVVVISLSLIALAIYIIF